MNKIREYAIENDVPIITDEGLTFICNLINKYNVCNILELGSAIGYSAINMVRVHDNVNVVTVERDAKRFNKALKYFKEYEVEDKVSIYNMDVFDFKTSEMFDIIFIDAAKAQYTKFFNMFKDNLNEGGVIVCDNLHFHGHVDNYENIQSRNLRQLVGKIKNFIEFLETSEDYVTEFFDIGDGMSITRRQK